MENIESYKRQEIALILLNIFVLAALFVVHIIFLFEIGSPSKYLLITLAVRFLILIFELIWLQKLDEYRNPKIITLHTHFSIWINIIFAFIASVFGGTADSHYSVLMIIPIIQAAYRFGLIKTIVIAFIIIALTFLEVWIFFKQKPPVDYGELFEAATVSLIFFVVGFVVWLLIGYLREEENKLKQSLEELRKAQEKLVAEEKFAAIGQLSSAIAHEIRNPVAMIASSLAMAEKQKPPVSKEMLGIATQEAKRLETLTGDFLLFARAKDPELRKTKIIDVLEYVSSLIKAKAAEQEIELNIFCNNGLEGKFDSTQIQQALLNLLMNALDSTPPKGKIILGAIAESDSIKIFVENTGERISDEISKRIFEPFYTTKPKGTGLGLAIVKNIVQSHQGEIILAKNENGSVRFEISIPGK